MHINRLPHFSTDELSAFQIVSAHILVSLQIPKAAHCTTSAPLYYPTTHLQQVAMIMKSNIYNHSVDTSTINLIFKVA